ncbi:hypothetical protein ACH5RR_023757 [Cinchona calisaya]|uniref:Uncharacterized protein n=1 Tax=Cinchona calisaya TaxID=153742 RepID=A0ABD2ZF03_9GENT
MHLRASAIFRKDLYSKEGTEMGPMSGPSNGEKSPNGPLFFYFLFFFISRSPLWDRTSSVVSLSSVKLTSWIGGAVSILVPFFCYLQTTSRIILGVVLVTENIT